jgi:hypothetical protein
MEFKGNLPGEEPSLSDWDWVKKQIADDAPVPYDANDPDDGPYHPNDDEAVDRFLTEENRVYPAPQAEAKKIAKAS